MESALINTYPRFHKIYDRKVYVLYPVQITKSDLKKLLSKPKVGLWMVVQVVKGGFIPFPAPATFETEAQAQKSADAMNKAYGYTPEEVLEILKWSFADAMKKEVANAK